ncbi:MAG: MMPL family transporter [Planctomycetaceae bacterium]|nr:MMPL family transporter [Planctomycetaceae bacterium]
MNPPQSSFTAGQIPLFRTLGHLAARRPSAVIVVWMVVLTACLATAPEWSSVVENGEFAFMPKDSPSVIGDQLFRDTFPDHSVSSSVVLVIERTTPSEGLLPEDHLFIENVLVPGLRRVVGLPEHMNEFPADAPVPANMPLRKLSYRGSDNIGGLYDSPDGQSSLIVLELKTEFLDQGNERLIADVEHFLSAQRYVPVNDPEHAPIPAGLRISFSGTATFGRDIIRESVESAKSTETWTVVLVVFLLLIMYRAPLLAIIPLLTVVVAGAASLSLLAIGAKLGWLQLFTGIDAYVNVLVYGAGVDYCLFLIARYREELESGSPIPTAISTALHRVGSALAASAGTTMCGIGMMAFAEFGKFRQAGIAIAFGLVICLSASLTLTPAILRLFGRWAFWPNIPANLQTSAVGGFVARPDRLSRLLAIAWKRIGRLQLKKPLHMWLGSLGVLLPFAIVGVTFFGYRSYGLISELPDTAPCVQGAEALQNHFPSGEVAPVRVLVRLPGRDFTQRSIRPPEDIRQFSANILKNGRELGVEAIRSLADPKGGRDIGKIIAAAERLHARKDYASSLDPEVTRLDLILSNDPFSRTSIEQFRHLRTVLPDLLPDSMKGATIYMAGETANLSDLKSVTDRDQIRVNALVTLVVFAILWVLLHKPGICAYLMFTVLFSYLATLGCTFLFFWAIDPSGFAGLDWKVPMFLFTILIAVGEDYNIFLLTRIQEERSVHGPVEGVTVALDRTGSIISSCGIIMAGTFSSLMAGSLVGMDQLGFALALGVLIDTFLVRPIMVPSFLILLAQGRAGVLGRLTGYAPTASSSANESTTDTSA